MNKKETKVSKEIKMNKKSARRNYSSQTGITLIALVVTIVVLLILAGVTINAVFSDSGIIKKAQDAQNKANESVQKDMEQINALENWLNENIGANNKDKEVNISTLVGKEAVTKNTKAVDAYGNKITIPKGFKVLAHGTEAGSATYTYSGDNIPAVQDGIIIENGTDRNQFVWVPVGTINNKSGDSRGTTSTITLGRYSDFTAKDGVYTPTQSAENYMQETTIKLSNIQNKNYTIAKLGLEDEKKNTIKINKAIQLNGTINEVNVIKTATTDPTNPTNPTESVSKYQELTVSREGNATAENATARDLKTFIETTLENGGYYIARFEASKNTTTNKIESKYDKTVLTNITQSNAATLARELYGEVKENNELVYASDLVNSYAWDTAIIFIQTYSTETDASNYASKNKSTSFANTGINNDKYCNICDMSGNAREWTTEYSTYSYNSNFYPCVFRGGYYFTDFGRANSCTSNRNSYITTVGNSNDGLRPLLYVK